jgi:hypothetical protein
MVAIGDIVKWQTSKKPLGVVIQRFFHKGHNYAIVEKPNGTLIVVRVYEQLQVV